jgi:hypothetical protein
MTHTEDVRRQWDGLESTNASRVADAVGAMRLMVASFGAVLLIGAVITVYWFALEPK